MRNDARRTRRSRLPFCALLLTMTIAAMTPVRSDTGHSHAADKPDLLGQGVALIQARKLYMSACAGCHGERGHGSESGTPDFSAAQALVELTRENFLAKLGSGHGGPDGGALDEADRNAVTAYVRTYLMLPAPDADTEIGRSIYARSCSVCHGDRGDSASWARNSLNPAPANFTTHGTGQLTRQEMINTVTFGKDRTAMVGFATQLTPSEIAATVDFIRTAFMPAEGSGGGDGHNHDHGRKHGSSDDHGSGDRVVAGDPVWGKAFYNANCAECHGKDGDGVGPRAYFMIVKPANFLSQEKRAELERPVLFERIANGVVGTTMPAWGKVLTEKQIASVGEYVYRAFLHPEAASDDDRVPGWRAVEPEADDDHSHGHGEKKK